MTPLIGILAGMGPRSTAPFIDLIVTECQRQYGAHDDIDFPKMMICSQPAPFYEDRPTNHAALEGAILQGLQHLERTGADFLAIACNTAHIYYPQLAKAVHVPLLNMVDLTVEMMPASVKKVALLTARPTTESRIYQTKLEQSSFAVMEIDWQAQIDYLLGATRATSDPAVFTALWHELIIQAEAAGVDGIIVACLDLSGILRYAATELPIIDAAQCLAQAIVQEWLLRRNSA